MNKNPDDVEVRGPRTPNPKPTSSAAAVAAQVRSRAAHAHNVKSLPQTRVEHGIHPTTGNPTLTATFPGLAGDDSHQIDLSFLLGFPCLMPMFIDAFLHRGARTSPLTRECIQANLRSGFFRYLEASWPATLAPQDIDDELLAAFRLDLMRTHRKNGKPLHPRSVTAYLGAVRSVLETLDCGVWAGTARAIADRVPQGPLGAGQRVTPTEVLGLSNLLSILFAAEREVLATAERFKRADMMIAAASADIPHFPRLHPGSGYVRTLGKYEDLANCLRALNAYFPGVIPHLEAIAKKDPVLAAAVQERHGYFTVISYFYPTPRDLVPFVLLLAITTVFNPETLLSLDWKDIDFNKEQAGVPAVEIIGEKNRAARDLVRLLDPDGAACTQLNVKELLLCLRRITARIRPHVAGRHEDRLFVYVQAMGGKIPKGFGSVRPQKASYSLDATWDRSLAKFILDNALPKFTLGQIRPTILDLIQITHGSLEAAQKVGNHQSPATTWNHYTSSGIRKRYRERIGQIIVMRERWFETEGAIDPRRIGPTQDKGAATPGFTCLDPLDSPRPGQQAGKLCKDYGACPSCAMAAAHPNDPLSASQYMALERAIFRSQPSMTATTWLERWIPVLADLRALLRLIPAHVLEESRKLSIELPNVG